MSKFDVRVRSRSPRRLGGRVGRPAMPRFNDIRPLIRILIVCIPNLLNLRRPPIVLWKRWESYYPRKRVTCIFQLHNRNNSVFSITGQLLKPVWCQQRNRAEESKHILLSGDYWRAGYERGFRTHWWVCSWDWVLWNTWTSRLTVTNSSMASYSIWGVIQSCFSTSFALFTS